MSNDVFQETPGADQIIGENGKYKNLDEAAKAIVEKDRFIEQLKSENAPLRKALEDKTASEDTFKKLLEAKPVVTEVPQNKTVVAQPSPDDLAKSVRNIISETEKENRTRGNIAEVAATLISKFGDESKAREVVQKKAAELGVSIQFLQSIAAQSPKAFYTQIGVEATPTATPAATKSDIRSTALAATPNESNPEPGTYAWFRKQHPNMKDFLSPSVQNAMMKAALADPDKFGVRE